MSAALTVGLVSAAPAGAATTAELRVGDVTIPEGNGPTNAEAKVPVSFSAPLDTPHCVWYHTTDVTANGDVENDDPRHVARLPVPDGQVRGGSRGHGERDGPDHRLLRY